MGARFPLAHSMIPFIFPVSPPLKVGGSKHARIKSTASLGSSTIKIKISVTQHSRECTKAFRTCLIVDDGLSRQFVKFDFFDHEAGNGRALKIDDSSYSQSSQMSRCAHGSGSFRVVPAENDDDRFLMAIFRCQAMRSTQRVEGYFGHCSGNRFRPPFNMDSHIIHGFVQ